MRWSIALACVTGAGCDHYSSSPGGPPPDPGEASGGADGSGGEGVSSAQTELRRLTQNEFEHSLRHVLGAVSLDGLEPDLVQAGLARVGARQVTTSTSGVDRFDLAIETAIDTAFSDQARLSQLIQCDVSDDTCPDAFIAHVGQRAWRRPLNANEKTRYRQLYDQCLSDTGETTQAFRCVTSGLLHSPYFLYRVELATNGVYLGYDMASRLAYFLWSSPPDVALLKAAYEGRLDNADGVRAEARRMLDDPKARRGVATFVDEWFRLDQLDRLERDLLAQTSEELQFELGRRGRLQPWMAELAWAMKEEIRRMVVGHVLDDDLDYLDLMITDRTYVTQRLKNMYELAVYEDEESTQIGSGDYSEEEQLRYDGPADAHGVRRAVHAANSPRRGLLGTAAVLSQLGKQHETSPTRRGLYVMEHFLCQKVGDPPDDIDRCERPDGVSRRDSIEAHHLCAESCSGCHTQMDPLGFALDRFDTIGRFRGTDDWGYALDTQVEWSMLRRDGSVERMQFDSLRTMADTFYNLPEATDCVTRQIYRFGTGREETDETEIAALTEAFKADGRKMKAFMIHFVGTDAFRKVPQAGGDEETPSGPPTLDQVFQQVFLASCAPCHTGTALGGLSLTNDGQLAERLKAPSAGVPAMPLVTPGSVDQSYLWHKVQGSHTDVGGGGEIMPPNQPLSDADKALLKAWIEGGAR
ncbi:MAG: DUF1592 domain-containing protein [Bradymonadia bacterium]